MTAPARSALDEWLEKNGYLNPPRPDVRVADAAAELRALVARAEATARLAGAEEVVGNLVEQWREFAQSPDGIGNDFYFGLMNAADELEAAASALKARLVQESATLLK